MRITSTTVDSPLGRWTHTQARPARLAHVVDHLWHFSGRTSMPRERLFPGGYLEVILHLGPRYHDVDARGATTSAFPTACVSGLLTRPAVIEAPTGDSCVLGVRLHPVGAYALFGAAVCDALDQTVDLAAMPGDAVEWLADRCYEEPTAEARLELVARWISHQLARSNAPHAHVAWVARQLECSDGLASVGALREQTGLGRARFVETFRRHTGLTPKRYARMLRFRRAMSLMSVESSLSNVALSAGYFDQSHLNADFREFAEMTPGEFLRAARYPASTSLQED